MKYKTNLVMIIVKYHAYLRKMTRYNPTRGGKLSLCCDNDTWRYPRLIDNRSLPFPCPIKNLLQDRPWHDSPQDRPRCRCYGKTQGFRGCPTTIRQSQESGCSPGFESIEIKARPKVLHSWQIEPRGWMEVPRCCCEVCYILGHSWNCWLTQNRLEERRKVKGAAYYARKKAARKQLSDAQKSAKVDDKTKKQLAEYGY